MPASGNRFYEEEDAQQILRMALAQSTPDSSLSRESLFATAAELGISPEALAEAEERYTREKAERTERETFESEQRRTFFSHAATYSIVNLGLLAFNLVDMSRRSWDTNHLWAIYPILGWGIGLAFHWVTTYRRDSEPYQKAFETWCEARRTRSESSEAVSSRHET